MTLSEKIAKRKKELDLTLDDIAKATGVARSTAGKWVNGDIKDMRVDKLENLVAVLGTTIDWLLDLDEDYTLYENAEKIPVPAEIMVICDTVKEKKQNTFCRIPDYTNADFAIRFKGDSMINARIFDGDLVFISTKEKIDNGDICAIIINNETHLKRVYKYQDRIELRPENPLFPVMNYEGEDMKKVQILGKAVSIFGGIK